jgi:DNA-directed RNA polymerase subunit F
MTGREIMINFIRDILRPKTLREILNKEMREAYLSKLEAEKALEYATSVVEYNRNRIRRLEERLNSLGDDDDDA